MMSSKSTSLSLISLCAGLVGVIAYYRVSEATKFKESMSPKQSSLLQEEQWIKSSILDTMPPAARLGITIGELNDKNNDAPSLSLHMPLRGNTNIHGTAFAGSLYSLAVLCAWYVITIRLRRAQQEGCLSDDDYYTVVLKSAEISYLRPVVDSLIVATSMFPTVNELGDFLKQLQHSGKAIIHIHGKIPLVNGKDAAQYTAVICAFKPCQAKT